MELLPWLVKIDRGLYGPVKCKRWKHTGPATDKEIEEQSINILTQSAICAAIVREPRARAVAFWHHNLHSEGSVCSQKPKSSCPGGVCPGCSSLAFEDAVDQLGASDVVLATGSNILLRRFGEYPNNPGEAPVAKYRRALRIIRGCSKTLVKTDAHLPIFVDALSKVAAAAAAAASIEADLLLNRGLHLAQPTGYMLGMAIDEHQTSVGWCARARARPSLLCDPRPNRA